MKIEINHCNNKKKFIDEITYISTKYDKLKIYPHQKIGLYTNQLSIGFVEGWMLIWV